MDFLNDLDCPQFVNFNTEFLADNSLEQGVENLSAASSVKKDEKTGTMETEDENSYLQTESDIEDMPSMLSESYTDDSLMRSAALSPTVSCKDGDFPVHHPKNLSLPEDELPKNTKTAKLTKVKPFNFAESKKRKRGISENEHSEHIPLAEQIAAFQKKTPQRFHTTGPKTFEPTEHWSPHLVRPKSPNLRAAKRQRKIDVLSREEQEQIEAEEIRKYKFRARPANQSILYRPHLPKVQKKTPTRPKSLQLRTAQRAEEIHSKKKTDEKPYEFHARPVPKAILDGPVGLKEKNPLPVTEAKTPNFALKDRAEKWRSQNKLNETAIVTETFKAVPAPAQTQPAPIKYEKKRTEIQPFSFEIRDKERMAKKEQKIKEEIAKENAVFKFKAQPLPSPNPSTLPPVPKKPPTKPEPFNFHSEERSFKHSFNSSLDQTNCTQFKAQPATVLEKPPFIPQKPPKQPVEIKEFQLHTDVRASERLKLKEIQNMKEKEKELLLQQIKKMQEEEERQEIEQLRKQAVHKAQPVRHYKPVEIKPSEIQPTQPVTPKFKTDERLRVRN